MGRGGKTWTETREKKMLKTLTKETVVVQSGRKQAEIRIAVEKQRGTVDTQILRYAHAQKQDYPIRFPLPFSLLSPPFSQALLYQPIN